MTDVAALGSDLGPIVSPLAGRLDVLDAGPEEIVGSVSISADEPVFAGHYPGFPILPGVCLVECVHRLARQVPPEGVTAVTLAAVETTRFTSPAFPGDTVVVRLSWRAKDDQWQARAKVETERGPLASVRLRFRTVTP